MEKICKSCGAVFDGGPKRKFCDACRVKRHRTVSREYRRERQSANKPALEPMVCRICGKTFVPKRQRVTTCSPECAKAAQRQAQYKWAAENRAKANANAARSTRKRIAAMSPEERQEYDARMRALWHAAYLRRKAAKTSGSEPASDD